MSTLLSTIQHIAVNAVRATNPITFAYGTVSSVDPLKIRIGEDGLEIPEEMLILTEPVVEKKLTIQKHTHTIGTDLQTHTHPYSGTCAVVIPPATVPITGESAGNTSASTQLQPTTKVDDTVLSAVCTEYGKDLPTESDDDKIVITLNRGLEKDDRVVMLKVSSGQQFIVLSRVFTEGNK